MHVTNTKIAVAKIPPYVNPTYFRKVNGRSMISFWPQGETMMDNLMNRRFRPHKEYSVFLPDIILDLEYKHGIVVEGKPKWRQKAGCTCGCSPGFLLTVRDSWRYNVNVWCDVEA